MFCVSVLNGFISKAPSDDNNNADIVGSTLIDSIVTLLLTFFVLLLVMLNDAEKSKLRFRQYNEEGQVYKEIKVSNLFGKSKLVEKTDFKSLDDIKEYKAEKDNKTISLTKIPIKHMESLIDIKR